MWWWFWLWVAFIVLLIFLPLGYGTRYRRWGPPYPRYYRGRGGRRVLTEPMTPEPLPPHGGWGWFSDVVWVLVVIAIIWIIAWAWAY